MARRRVEAGGLLYTFAPDDALPAGQYTWAMIKGRVIDEISGLPPFSPVHIVAREAGFVSRVAGDGLFGVAGIPMRLFPQLATQPSPVHLMVTAEGYIPRQLQLTFGPEAGFPETFTPLDCGDVLLHREPVIPGGRTVLDAASTILPLAGVSVRITNIWRTFSSPGSPVAAEPPNIISLQPALYFSRAMATTGLRRRDMTPVAGEEKQLLSGVAAGSNQVYLSNRINLTPGDLLLVDPLSQDRMEYLVIQAINGASTDDQPATITFHYPMLYEHRSNILVYRVILQAAGPAYQLAQDALVGDNCVFLNTVNGLDLAQIVEITDGINPLEYHNLSLFAATSDAAGYFRLPALSRVAQVELQADDGGTHAPVTLPKYSPDYSVRANFIHFTFR